MSTFRLLDASDSEVGGADSLEAAASLAAGHFARNGEPVRVLDGSGEVVAHLAPAHEPSRLAAPPALSLAAAVDPEIPLLVKFTLQGAAGDAEVNYGDGEEGIVLVSEEKRKWSFEHSYAKAGVYRVTVFTETQFAEVYAHPS